MAEANPVLRVVTKLADHDAFIAHFSRLVDGRRMLIATRDVLPDGSEHAFQVLLADGRVAFAGTGRVSASFPPRPGRRLGGLRLDILTLDEPSLEVHLLLLVARMPIPENDVKDTVPVSPELLASLIPPAPAAAPVAPVAPAAAVRGTQPLDFSTLKQLRGVGDAAGPATAAPTSAADRATRPLSPLMMANLRGLANPALLPPMAPATDEPGETPVPAAPFREVDPADLERFIDAHVRELGPEDDHRHDDFLVPVAVGERTPLPQRETARAPRRRPRPPGRAREQVLLLGLIAAVLVVVVVAAIQLMR